jgi:hypothetical protein
VLFGPWCPAYFFFAVHRTRFTLTLLAQSSLPLATLGLHGATVRRDTDGDHGTSVATTTMRVFMLLLNFARASFRVAS